MAIQVVCDFCKAEYNLKDDLGGKKLRCKKCEQVLVVPEVDYQLTDSEIDHVDHGYHPAFDRDKFFVSQKRIAINQKYFIFDENKTPILYVERPARLGRGLLSALAFIAVLLLGFLAVGGMIAVLRGQEFLSGLVAIIGLIASFAAAIATAIWLTPLRHITIYSDPTKQEPLVEILQQQKFVLYKATYLVRLADGTPMALCIKNYLYNFFRKRWYVNDPSEVPLLVAKEDSVILSLLRRLLGELAWFIRTNFIIHPAGSDEVVGEFNRKFTFFDRYVLDLSADPNHRVDRRLGVALAVLLDTGERR